MHLRPSGRRPREERVDNLSELREVVDAHLMASLLEKKPPSLTVTKAAPGSPPDWAAAGAKELSAEQIEAMSG